MDKYSDRYKIKIKLIDSYLHKATIEKEFELDIETEDSYKYVVVEQKIDGIVHRAAFDVMSKPELQERKDFWKDSTNTLKQEKDEKYQ